MRKPLTLAAKLGLIGTALLLLGLGLLQLLLLHQGSQLLLCQHNG